MAFFLVVPLFLCVDVTCFSFLFFFFSVFWSLSRVSSNLHWKEIHIHMHVCVGICMYVCLCTYQYFLRRLAPE